MSGGPHRRAGFGFILASIFLEALAFGLIFPVLPRLVLDLSHGEPPRPRGPSV